MAHYSVQPGDRIFVKGYGFLSFVNNRNKNIGKDVSKNFSSKYSQKFLNHAKEFATKRLIQKKEEATGDLIGNKIADKITKVSRTSPQYTPETVKSQTEKIGFDREIPKQRYIYPEKRQKPVDDLRLM